MTAPTQHSCSMSWNAQLCAILNRSVMNRCRRRCLTVPTFEMHCQGRWSTCQARDPSWNLPEPAPPFRVQGPGPQIIHMLNGRIAPSSTPILHPSRLSHTKQLHANPLACLVGMSSSLTKASPRCVRGFLRTAMGYVSIRPSVSRANRAGHMQRPWMFISRTDLSSFSKLYNDLRQLF